jgi:hypothetical protein
MEDVFSTLPDAAQPVSITPVQNAVINIFLSMVVLQRNQGFGKAIYIG